MSSNYNHFVQKGYGNFEDYDDGIESEHSSQSSTSSEEMESSQEEEPCLTIEFSLVSLPSLNNEIFCFVL